MKHRVAKLCLALTLTLASAGAAFAAPAFSKTVAVVYDPINGILLPKSIPRALEDYTITVTNTGSLAIGSVVISDPIPANVELYVGDLNGLNSGPVVFTNVLLSTLGYTYSGLNSTTDSLEFSNNNGTNYNYLPQANAEGFDPNVTNIRVRPSGSMIVTGISTVRFRVRIK